jgi:hypothetical protein
MTEKKILDYMDTLSESSYHIRGLYKSDLYQICVGF